MRDRPTDLRLPSLPRHRLTRITVADRSRHLIGLLLGAEEDWPQAFEALLQRVGPVTSRRARARVRVPAADHRAVRPERPGPGRAGDRPARVLVLPPARVAEEGRADERHLPAELAVHVPVDGEALGVLRDAPARTEDPADRAGAVQEPGRQRALGLHVGEVQQVVRPGRDRRRPRLPAVHEAVRRRRLAGRLPDQQSRTTCTGVRRVRRDADAPAGHRSSTTSSPGRCRSAPRRW